MAQTTVNKAYNDGLCEICREIAAPSSFSARQGATTIKDLDMICKLCFAESSRRMEDSSYADQMGYRLDRKISTRRPEGIKIDTECSALIGNTLYHISNVDYSTTELYLFLTEVTEIARED